MIDTKRLATDAAYWDECGAPEDATHFVSGGETVSDVFWRIEADVGVEAWAVGHSGLVHYPDPTWVYESMPDAIPRPQSEWVEGLPPLMTRVECTFAVENHDTWRKGKVTFHGIDPEGREFFIVDTGIYQACYRSTDHVRPLRTRAQRDRDELARTIRESPLDMNGRAIMVDVDTVVDAIIAAGWRKER